MAKKKKDDFGIPPVGGIKDLREGRYTSFYIRPPKIEVPKDVCDIKINDFPDLDIIKTKGRLEGTKIIYSPEETYNYFSQSQRYDRGIEILPDKIEETETEIIYYFCQPDSANLFWEVRVPKGQLASFLRFIPGVLTIICPSPFNLQDLVVVETDATFLNWSQLQGRETIVFPANQEQETSNFNSLNPVISIIGDRPTDSEDKPILLLAETNNPLVAEILAIRTTIRDFLQAPSIRAPLAIVGNSSPRLSPSAIYPRLGVYNSGKLVSISNNSFFIVFTPPELLVSSVTEYELFFNNLATGYISTSFTATNNSMQFPVAFGLRYKIVTERLVNNQQQESVSKPFEFINPFFIAADLYRNASLRGFRSDVIRYKLKVLFKTVQDTSISGSIRGFRSNSVKYKLKVKLQSVVDNSRVSSIIGFRNNTVTRFKLNGQVVG